MLAVEREQVVGDDLKVPPAVDVLESRSKRLVPDVGDSPDAVAFVDVVLDLYAEALAIRSLD